MFSVDRIENNVVILENINNGEKKEVDISDFSFNIKEKDILLYDGVKYILSNKDKNERINFIRDKMNKLKK